MIINFARENNTSEASIDDSVLFAEGAFKKI
jgi:hypothetical protein